MRYVFLAIIVGVFVAEIELFSLVGGWVGLWPTIGIIVLSAMAGGAMLRAQGLGMLIRAQESMQVQGQALAEMLERIGIILAAILLLIPGFFTDGVGLMLFFPPLRRTLVGVFMRRGPVNRQFQNGGGEQPGNSGPVIDGEYHEVQPKNDNTPRIK
ncbi:MAG: FxsA family protein [Rhodospirillales bacterium]|jgi:UPF0716 protein FxsA|nr:FxsA family protein [Rhodospirillales bacterium]